MHYWYNNRIVYFPIDIPLNFVSNPTRVQKGPDIFSVSGILRIPADLLSKATRDW